MLFGAAGFLNMNETKLLDPMVRAEDPAAQARLEELDVRAQKQPRGSKYAVLEVFGSKSHTLRPKIAQKPHKIWSLGPEALKYEP